MDQLSTEQQLLIQERQLSSFPVKDLMEYIYGGAQQVQRIEKVRKIIEENEIFDKSRNSSRNHQEAYKIGLAKSVELLKTVFQKGLSPEEGRLCYEAVDTWLPISLHLGMFMTTIMGQGTEEQVAKWYPLAQRFEIVGTYAQTELGHGSNLRAIETTATYNKNSQEFIIHSPTITSLKWWPGGLGKTSNYCIIMARLIIEGKDMGVHSFILQLRSLEDHKPLPGITLGDIGPKLGFNSTDNGFLRVNNVRIPRDQMLMKYAKVHSDGTYEKPLHSKSAYGTMIFIRANLVSAAARNLARAVTIVTRYSAVRRQGFLRSETQEEQILDYKMQQYQVFKNLSSAYAFIFAGEYMRKLYQKTSLRLTEGKFDLLPETHATSAGLKAISTRIAAEGIEECRKCCGGQGYSHLSGLPELLSDAVAAQTYEGDNIVLLQQTARFLLKSIKAAKKGKKIAGNSKYIEQLYILQEKCSATCSKQFLETEIQRHALTHRALRLISETAEKMRSLLTNGKSFGEAWNILMIDLCKMSEVHCFLVTSYSFSKAVKNAPLSIQNVLKKLCDLFVLHQIETNSGDFFEDGYMNRDQIIMVREQVSNLLEVIRPDAVCLVDAFGFSDKYLNSAIGLYDGNIYAALFDAVKKEPLNQNDIPPGYKEYLRPLIKGEVWAKL